jgi:hypothetical protein
VARDQDGVAHIEAVHVVASRDAQTTHQAAFVRLPRNT